MERHGLPRIRKNGLAQIGTGIICVSLCLFFYLCPSAYSEEQTRANTEILTLEQCIKYALANNPKLQEVLGTVDLNRAKVGEAKSDYLPQATHSVSYTHASASTGLVSTSGVGVKGNTYTAQTGAEQLIWDFGKTLNQIKLAHENLSLAQLSFLEVQEETIFRTKEAYFNVLKAEFAVDIAEENLRFAKNRLERTNGFYAVGLKQKFDLTQAESLVSNAYLDYVKANKSLSLAKATLNNMIGKIGETNYEVENNLDFKPVEVNLNAALQTAMKSRNELLKYEAQVKASQTDLAVKKAGNWPKITTDANYGSRDTQATGTVDGWTLGVLFKWPWFDGFRTRSQAEVAQANLKIAKANLQGKTLDIVLEVQDVVLSLGEAQAKVNTVAKLLQEADENYNLIKARYEEGLNSKIELKDSEISWVCARKNYATAIVDYLISQAKYEKSIGVMGQDVVK